jgi:hypothetical protein
MAQKRMFDKAIIDTDKFMDLAMSSKALYFLLGMEADDEGFVSYKKVMRVHGGNDDDIKILTAKGFLIMFPSGVVVITDWNKNNWLDSRRIVPTEYQTEKKMLIINKQKEYLLSNGLAMAKQPLRENRIEEKRIEENRIDTSNSDELQEVKITKKKSKPSSTQQLGENSEDNTTNSADVPLIIKEFESINPAVKRMYGNKTQRQACEDLINTYGLERILSIISKTLPKTNQIQYFPVILTPLQLRDKFSALESAIQKFKNEKTEKESKHKVAFY